jgi:ABC-2 type transport system permease protein
MIASLAKGIEMRNVFLVVRHEIATVFAKRSFWIMTFLFPILIIGINVGTQIVAERAFEQTQAPVGQQRPIGYVDEANLVSRLPELASGQEWLAFDGREQAQRALEVGEVARYYIVPENYVQTGELVLVEQNFAPFSVLAGGADPFERILQANLIDDEQVAALLLDPIVSSESRALAPQEGPDRESPFSFWVPYATMFLFFFSLTQSSGLMLTSVSKEKENQTAEVLLLSLRPRELMLGKVIGLGTVAALQLSVWAIGGALLLNRSSGAMVAGYSLSPSFFFWGALYFIFGYLTYAAALGAVGVLAPTAREGAQFTFIVLLPLMIPLWLNAAFTQEPNGTLAIVLSLFPLTAPLAMVTRLVSGNVPFWQPAIGVLGLAATAYLFVLLAARLFRADTLLSSASLNARRVLEELRSS